ncbi:MAG: hypothetical protein LUD81_00620, partial [Clostridiales bacterium]|nr:hypothetical protein [Clostridiales bacterium]
MKNTEKLPGDFIRECLGDGVLPYLIIEGDKNIFDLELMRGFAEELGYYNTKAYIELYPIYAIPTFNKEAYKRFYREAVSLFKEYAPKTEIVWATASDYVYDEGDLLPIGADIDYIGISVVLGINGEDNSPKIQGIPEYLSRTYGLPLIITRFGVVDYSEKNHRYYKNEKIPYITEGLKNLPWEYPGIVGILVFETDDYMYEGFENKLKLSNSDEAVRLAAEYISEFKAGQGLEKLPFILKIKGETAYISYKDFSRIFGKSVTQANTGKEEYINLSRYFEEKGLGKIFVSEKNRYVIFPENSV